MMRFIILLYVFIALIYVFAVPPYEAPDELYHMGFVHHVADTWQLPVQERGEWKPWRQEGSQPPLYYLVSAPLITLIDREAFPENITQNPQANMGNPALVGNKNRILHDNAYAFNFDGSRLALTIVRLFSVFCATVTIFGVYKTAQVATQGRENVALLAAGLTAFNPQFVFISASANNDNLITALGSLIMWQTLVMLQNGFTTQRSVLLGVLIALASLSKISGLVFMIAVLICALWLLFRKQDIRGFLIFIASVVVTWLLIAGWWYLRNLTLYGEFLGTSTMLDIFGRRPPLPIMELLIELESLRISYWGLFGWFSIYAPEWFYWLTTGLMLAAIIGLIAYLWQSRRDEASVIPVLWLGVVIGGGFSGLILWTLQTTGTQGRLLFPYIAAFSTLLAIGLSQLRFPTRIVLPGFAIITAVMPFMVIVPNYAQPWQVEQIPDTAISVDLVFDEQIAIVGYETSQARYTAGDTIELVVYWQPQVQSALDYEMFVHLINRSTGEILARLDSFPGMGSLRTSTWQTNTIYADEMSVKLPDKLDDYGRLEINVGLWFPEWGVNLTTADGLSALAFPAGVYGPEKITTQTESFTAPEAPIVFGDAIRLLGWRVEDDNTVSLLWQAESELEENLVIGMFLFDRPYVEGEAFNVLQQADASPILPTRWWREGETFITSHDLDISTIEDGNALYLTWYSLVRDFRLSYDGASNMAQIVIPN